MGLAEKLLMILETIKKPINELINRSIEEGDGLLSAVMEERETARGTVTRKIGYKKLASIGKAPIVQVMSAAGNVIDRSRRACSVCREPGHRAGNVKCKGLKK